MPFSRSFGTNETQQLREGPGGSNVASEASYWCNWRETREIQVRAYTGQRGTLTHMRSIIHSLPWCNAIPPRVPTIVNILLFIGKHKREPTSGLTL